MFIVSACLAGKNCKYNGGNNDCEWVKKFIASRECLLVCPEAELLGSPRPPSEIKEGRAVDKTGRDITEILKDGAAGTWEKALAKAGGKEKIEGAVLKANSPSCGCGKIYDGTFTGTLVDGDGFFAALLKEKGVNVTTEREVLL